MRSCKHCFFAIGAMNSAVNWLVGMPARRTILSARFNFYQSEITKFEGGQPCLCLHCQCITIVVQNAVCNCWKQNPSPPPAVQISSLPIHVDQNSRPIHVPFRWEMLYGKSTTTDSCKPANNQLPELSHELPQRKNIYPEEKLVSKGEHYPNKCLPSRNPLDSHWNELSATSLNS